MNPFGGRCFRDAALCKFAGLKRRVWGLREKCRLMKPLPTWHSSSEELGREKYFVPRMEIGHAAHLTELLRLRRSQLRSQHRPRCRYRHR